MASHPLGTYDLSAPNEWDLADQEFSGESALHHHHQQAQQRRRRRRPTAPGARRSTSGDELSVSAEEGVKDPWYEPPSAPAATAKKGVGPVLKARRRPVHLSCFDRTIIGLCRW